MLVEQILLAASYHMDYSIMYAWVCEKEISHICKNSWNSYLVYEKFRNLQGLHWCMWYKLVPLWFSTSPGGNPLTKSSWITPTYRRTNRGITIINLGDFRCNVVWIFCNEWSRCSPTWSWIYAGWSKIYHPLHLWFIPFLKPNTMFNCFNWACE